MEKEAPARLNTEVIADRFYKRSTKDHDLSSAEVNALLWTISEQKNKIKDLATNLTEAINVLKDHHPTFCHILRACVERNTT